MRNFAPLLLALALCHNAVAAATGPDLASSEGFTRTCAATGAPATLKSNQQRQAFAVCRDVALARQVTTFVKEFMRESKDRNNKPSARDSAIRLRKQLVYMRDELKTVRQVLENTKLKPGEGLVLAPANWQVDLDSDGSMKTWERYFFAIPARGGSAFNVRAPSDDPAYYRAEYKLDARFKVDQSDISWSLGYHYFAEALVEAVLAYTVRKDEFSSSAIELKDPDGLKRARQLLVKGFSESEKMRRMVVAETDNDQEWIANPNQADTVFPIHLDEQDFRVWGELMGHVIPVFEGKALLRPQENATGMLARFATLCPAGQGVNLRYFFDHPRQNPTGMLDKDYVARSCQKIDKAHPASGLLAFAASYEARAQTDGAGMGFLRRLLWAN
jgi:hypothetical protein